MILSIKKKLKNIKILKNQLIKKFSMKVLGKAKIIIR